MGIYHQLTSVQGLVTDPLEDRARSQSTGGLKKSCSSWHGVAEELHTTSDFKAGGVNEAVSQPSWLLCLKYPSTSYDRLVGNKLECAVLC